MNIMLERGVTKNEGVKTNIIGGKKMSEKIYEPHFIIVWASVDVAIDKGGTKMEVAVKEFPYKEDAYEQYNELIQKGVQKIALAKLIKKHVEG